MIHYVQCKRLSTVDYIPGGYFNVIETFPVTPYVSEMYDRVLLFHNHGNYGNSGK